MQYILGLIVLMALAVAIFWLLQRHRRMFRRELPRIYELRDLISDPEAENSYLKNLDASLAESSLKLEHYRVLEADFCELDTVAWSDLKDELKPLLIAKDPLRGWQALFDILQHAKAYVHLKRTGCTNIRLVKQSKTKKQSIVDLEASRGDKLVFCEVKTVNISQEEAMRRISGGVGTSGDPLSTGFYAKLDSDLAKAARQLTAHANGRKAECLIFIVVHFDDNLHEYADRYKPAIEAHLASHPLPSISTVLNIKEAFGVSY